MIEEVWKDIPHYEGEYQASNLGRIKSLDRAVKKNNGMIQNRKGKILSQYKDTKGYYTLRLNGKMYKVHRLIYLTFVGDIPDGMQVNHIDENKDNNSVSNLNLMCCKQNRNWGTAIERGVEKHQKLLRKKIECFNYKTGELLYTFESITKAAETLNISHGTISAIVNHRPLKTKVNDKEYVYYRHQINGYSFKLANALTEFLTIKSKSYEI